MYMFVIALLFIVGGSMIIMFDRTGKIQHVICGAISIIIGLVTLATCIWNLIAG